MSSMVYKAEMQAVVVAIAGTIYNINIEDSMIYSSSLQFHP